MDLTQIVIAGITFLGSMIGVYFANSKTTALLEYRLKALEDKVSKHNNLVERMYAIEKKVAVIEEEIK